MQELPRAPQHPACASHCRSLLQANPLVPIPVPPSVLSLPWLCCVLSLSQALPSFGLNWGKQAKTFILMRALGRAGTGAGRVKFWEYQNLCAVGMPGMQRLTPLLVPCGQGG